MKVTIGSEDQHESALVSMGRFDLWHPLSVLNTLTDISSFHLTPNLSTDY